jgi:hypothetical protein
MVRLRATIRSAHEVNRPESRRFEEPVAWGATPSVSSELTALPHDVRQSSSHPPGHFISLPRGVQDGRPMSSLLLGEPADAPQIRYRSVLIPSAYATAFMHGGLNDRRRQIFEEAGGRSRGARNQSTPRSAKRVSRGSRPDRLRGGCESDPAARGTLWRMDK